MNAGTCPFAAQAQSESAATCPFGFGSAQAPESSQSSTSTSSALICPLGFGGGEGTYSSAEKRPTPASFANAGLPRMPLAVLASHPNLVSVKGVVFDVANVEAYQAKLASWAGHDASRGIAVSGGSGADAGAVEGLDEGLSGLRYEEHQRLEAYFLEMARSQRPVAVLTDEDHTRIFGAPLTTGSVEYSPATATLAAKTGTSDRGHVEAASQSSFLAVAAELHAAVEQGDAEAVTRVLSHREQRAGDPTEGTTCGGDGAENKQAQRRGSTLPPLVDCACPRTGLTPLLKAVEGGSEEVVRVLLEAGGDVHSQAVLYDADDALALAQRLRCSDAIVDMIALASCHR